MIRVLLATFFAFSIPSLAFADLDVRFLEGAPKDRFIFHNNSNCSLETARLVLDLSGSSAGLIFDVTGKGAGVEVFQPLEVVSGADVLRSVPEVRDGDNTIVFDVQNFMPGDEIAFTIDVDDTAGAREITVDQSEIMGAAVVLHQSHKRTKARFEAGAAATVPLTSCPS